MKTGHGQAQEGAADWGTHNPEEFHAICHDYDRCMALHVGGELAFDDPSFIAVRERAEKHFRDQVDARLGKSPFAERIEQIREQIAKG